MTTLLRDVEVEDRRVDVLLRDGRVAALGTGLADPVGASHEEVDGSGHALLPGLHDHHVHVLALAAVRRSVDVGSGDLGATLRAAPGTGWVRATGYHESVVGHLDRDILDQLLPDRPVRVQHRSGGLWILNSRALEVVDPDESADVERDASGRPTGRLWRYDERLRAALPRDTEPPDIGAVGRQLADLGITGVTDATPDLDAGAIDLLRRLPQRLSLLGGDGPLPRKVLLRDHDLPDLDTLAALIGGLHATGRPVAVHCVTRESLLLTLVALDRVGPLPGDRIEHAAVVPPEIVPWLARLGVRVVTQPDFLRTRGDTYLLEVETDDHPYLYPYAGLLAVGVRVCASSDAPFGEIDPWQVIASANSRLTAAGTAIGPDERVPTRTALAGYLTPPEDPGGAPRRVTVGAPADLVLLDRSLDEALREPAAVRPRATWIAGRRADSAP